MKKLFFICFLSSLVFSSILENECANENTSSCIKLAKHFQFDKEDIKGAMYYYEKACMQYDFKSCKSVSDIYKYSSSFKDEEKAEEYKELTIKTAKQLCDYKDANACYELANYCDVKYINCSKDDLNNYYKLAFYLYEKECNNNVLSSCHELANFYLNGIGVKENIQKALDIYKYNCTKLYSTSCNELANYYSYEAKRLYEKACSLGYKKSCDN